LNTELRELLAEIHRLQEEAEKRWDALREQFNYTLEGHKVRFASEVRRIHRMYQVGLLRYFARARPLNILTAPVIYSMSLPLVFLDATLTLYQHICFRAYGISRVRHRDYIVIDRHQLAYLNAIEKFNCVYCSYANGLMAYAREIVARTEQYWCPIKHAQRVRSAHPHYNDFAEYGDAAHYQEQLSALRKALADQLAAQHKS
jgi:hypothetical protein